MKRTFVLLLAIAFVAGLVTQVAATNCDKAQAAQELTDKKAEVEGAAEEQKVEIKGKVEEEKGKATLEMEKHVPEAAKEEVPAAPKLVE